MCEHTTRTSGTHRGPLSRAFAHWSPDVKGTTGPEVMGGCSGSPEMPGMAFLALVLRMYVSVCRRLHPLSGSA